MRRLVGLIYRRSRIVERDSYFRAAASAFAFFPGSNCELLCEASVFCDRFPQFHVGPYHTVSPLSPAADYIISLTGLASLPAFAMDIGELDELIYVKYLEYWLAKSLFCSSGKPPDV
ncbi:hypothetical protein E5288_WYG000298 [Bos mutus]|uniref:Uncharacterized protein n=1 Tax=Bos mutus TaxID=72004 RepID=A0A6B0QN62_9CETA|nr:hypothetical protein [Bos mutus]